jgi:hypothetical protein
MHDLYGESTNKTSGKFTKTSTKFFLSKIIKHVNNRRKPAEALI